MPTSLAFAPAGRLFVADPHNASIRVGTPATLLDAATIDAATGLPGQHSPARHGSANGDELAVECDPEALDLRRERSRRPTCATPRSRPTCRISTSSGSPPADGSSTSITTVSHAATAGIVTIESVSRLLPIVLDVSSSSAHYATELALTNNTAARLDRLDALHRLARLEARGRGR